MFNLLNQAKAQILIISNYEVQLFIWEKQALRYDSSYSDTSTGHSQFTQAVSSYTDYPVIIISNFIEETFRTETIAPVSGNDRKALLERKLNYTFRNTPYRTAKVSEREKTGRRDYKVLLSALTKPELLNPWVKAILLNNIAIQSVSSMAYLTEAFVQSSHSKKEDYLLVVSLERGTELRQTFLSKGKVSFSRLTSLSSQEAAALGDDIHRESLQIRSYLERIKLLPYDAVLKVNVFSSLDSDEFLSSIASNELNTFETFNTQQQSHAYALELNAVEPSAAILFLAHTLKKKRFGNTYAPFSARRYHHLKTTSRALVYFSLAIIAISFSTQIPNVLETLDNWQQQKNILAQTNPFLTEYDILKQDFPATPIPSKEMELVVKTYESIKAQSYLPADTVAIISQSLAYAPNLKLTEIHWELLEKKQEAVEQGFGGFGYSPPGNSDPQSAFKSAILENRTHIIVTISGFAFSPSSYREVQNQVLNFSNALNAHPEVSVTPLKMPTEIRTDTAVSTIIDGNELKAAFSLELDIGPKP